MTKTNTTSNAMTTMAEIRRVADETLAKLGTPDVQLDISFNARFTSRMGDARLDRKVNPAQGIIRLSKPLWPKATPEERRETVIHEVCHIVQDIKYPFSRTHGSQWKRLMVQVGVTPKTYHSVDTSEVKRKKVRHEVVCRCRSHKVGPRVYKNLVAGAKYKCRQCGHPIQVKTTAGMDLRLPPIDMAAFVGAPAPEARRVAAQAQAPVSEVIKTCPKCQTTGYIDTAFGWRRMKVGGSVKIRPQSYCRSCRRK